jgi:hypothetical protein
MRALLSTLALLLSLWLVMTLVQRQLSGVTPTSEGSGKAPAQAPQQIQQQYQDALDEALKQNQRKLDGETEPGR